MSFSQQVIFQFENTVRDAVQDAAAKYVAAGKTAQARAERQNFVNLNVFGAIDKFREEKLKPILLSVDNTISNLPESRRKSEILIQKEKYTKALAPKAQEFIAKLLDRISTASLVVDTEDQSEPPSDGFDALVDRGFQFLQETGADPSDYSTTEELTEFYFGLADAGEVEEDDIGKLVDHALSRYKDELALYTKATKVDLYAKGYSPLVEKIPRRSSTIEFEGVQKKAPKNQIKRDDDPRTDAQLVDNIKENKYKNASVAQRDFVLLMARNKGFIYANLSRSGIRSFESSMPSYSADDIYQDVVISAWGAIDDFNNESAVSTWLTKIAKNRLISLARHERGTRVEEFEDEQGNKRKRQVIRQDKPIHRQSRSVSDPRAMEAESFAEEKELAELQSEGGEAFIKARDAEIEQAVIHALDEYKKRDLGKNAERNIEIYIDVQFRGIKQETVAEKNGIKQAAVSKIVSDVTQYLIRDPELRKLAIERGLANSEDSESEVSRKRNPMPMNYDSFIYDSVVLDFYTNQVVPTIQSMLKLDRNSRENLNDHSIESRAKIFAEVMSAVKDEFRMPLEIGYATGYARYLIYDKPQPRVTSLPIHRAAQIRTFLERELHNHG